MTDCRLVFAAWEHSSARGAALAVLEALAILADENGMCSVSQKYLATIRRVSPRAIREAVARLIASGDISVQGRSSTGNSVYLVHPGGINRQDSSCGAEEENFRQGKKSSCGAEEENFRQGKKSSYGVEEENFRQRKKSSYAPGVADINPAPACVDISQDKYIKTNNKTRANDDANDVSGEKREGLADKARRLAPQCERMMDVLGIDPAKDWKGPQKVRDVIFEFDAEGADFDRDVWPVVDRIMAAQRRKGGSVTTPGYFRAAVMDAIAARAASEGAALAAPADPLAGLAGTRRHGRMVKIVSFIKVGAGSWPEMWGQPPTDGEMDECRALYAAAGQSLGSDMRGAA